MPRRGYSFAGALRAWKESLCPPLPEAVLLDVLLYQWPEMPNGCEATALTMLLQYYGFAADKLSVAYDYIPRSDFTYTWFSTYWPDPASAYAGDPALFGFTAWPPAWPKEQTVILRNRTARCARWISAARTVTCSKEPQLEDGRWWSGRPSALSPVVYSDYSWRLYSDSSGSPSPKTCTVLWRG